MRRGSGSRRNALPGALRRAPPLVTASGATLWMRQMVLGDARVLSPRHTPAAAPPRALTPDASGLAGVTGAAARCAGSRAAAGDRASGCSAPGSRGAQRHLLAVFVARSWPGGAHRVPMGRERALGDDAARAHRYAASAGSSRLFESHRLAGLLSVPLRAGGHRHPVAADRLPVHPAASGGARSRPATRSPRADVALARSCVRPGAGRRHHVPDHPQRWPRRAALPGAHGRAGRRLSHAGELPRDLHARRGCS